MNTIVETERLLLRELTADDAPFMLALLNDPDWLRNIGDRGVRTLAQAAAYIAGGPAQSYARHGFGLYLVALKLDQAPAGICGLIQRDYLPDPDIGFAFLPAYRSMGYAREAAASVLRTAASRGIRRVVAIVAPGNRPSAALLEALGMRFEAMVLPPGATSALQLFRCTLSAAGAPAADTHSNAPIG